MEHRRFAFLDRVLVVLIAAIAMFYPMPVAALSQKLLDRFAQNNILFYNPEDNNCTVSNTMGNSDGSDVSMFGDSISAMSMNAIKKALPKISLDAISGTWFNKDDDTYGKSGVSRVKASSGLRDIVVVAMGTNGGVTASDIDALVSAVNADGKSHKIILMTIYVEELAANAFAGKSNMMYSTNSAVKTASSKYSFISYADWAETVKNTGSASVIGDGHVHPTDPVGTELFAKTIQTAVNKQTSIGQMSVSSQSEITGTGAERVKSATRVYGEIAMQAQRTYGVPWEVLIAQMQVESNIGQSPLALQTNNWLGIRGTGDAGTYQTENNGNFAKFSSVEVSIQAWAGSYVMRNGYYDAAFQYLDPSNWDLHSYLIEVIHHYAPSSDGNNEAGYVANVESIIENMIKPAREEMGWPSSEEFARQNNIAIGGMYPIGTEVGNDLASISLCGQSFNGDINATAIYLSWPDRGHDPWDDVKPEYRTALKETGISSPSIGDSCSQNGNSCDAFVATVMRYSKADPDFYCCGISYMNDYLDGHPELYQEIPNIGSADNMMPGDIRISDGHVEMYIVEDGVGKIASASHCDRTGDRGINYYPDSDYRIFRKI